MKKLVSTVLAGVMAASLVGCSSSKNNAGSSAKGSSDSSSDMKVAMITDYGDITDMSFNQTTYEASKAWAEENGAEFEYKKPATDADADREASIEEAIDDDGYNVIVMPGYAFAQAIVDEAPKYPDVKFIALDVAQADLDDASGKKDWSSDNVFSAVYQEELAGYMAGYAAVKLGYTKLGFLGGMAVPAVIRYGFGYVQGADEAAKELGNASDVTVNYVYGGQFRGDADITARMDTWYTDGTQVVFACGGGIYTSAAEASGDNGKLIGVDVDQKKIIDKNYGEGKTVTSAMKGLAATVNTLLDAIKDDKWDDYKGKVETLGLVDGDDPSKNYVQLGTTQWSDGFTEDDYKALVKKMFDGDIKVSDATDKMPATDIKINDEGSIKG
ncbi:MAG: BMP family ABC transporter substrate-binding protein [Erysipelotrichaceae bacterium]|nr:BMP family ABC transporter substrate-binding protein [Erysipelotrichaceae bacterium]